MGDTYNQNNVHGDNHMHFGKQPFELTDGAIDSCLLQLNPQLPITLVTVQNQSMGDRLEAAIAASGFRIQRRIRTDSFGTTQQRTGALSVDPMRGWVVLDPTYG